MSDDRRATIEAALNEEEGSEGQTTTQSAAPTPDPTPREPAPPQGVTSPSGSGNEGAAISPAPPPEGGDKGVSGENAPAKIYSTDKPPQSWRPAQKAKWDALDPELKQEVIRRERDMERTLGETAQARQVANAFNQVVSPYMARIDTLGVSPIIAVRELLKADHILTTAPKTQRAALMAKLIKDYAIDIAELDSALAGQPQTDPVESKVQALLQQRLAPFEQFISQHRQNQQQQIEQSRQQVATTIEQMEADTEKYPAFQDVRQDMADIIDIQAKKGVYFTLDQAYSRAVAMNPEISQRVNDLGKNRAQTQAAREANARAQRAKAAAKSVGGAPSGGTSGAPVANDRRSTIAAALDQSEGR